MAGQLNFDVNKVSVVSISDIRTNDYNPKEKNTPEYQKVKKSIETNGQKLPIVVREKDGYEIIDGEQRFTAMKELGYDKAIIYNEGGLSDEEAKSLTVWYEQQVPFEEVALSKIVKELWEKNIALPYSDVEVEEFVAMADFDFDQYNAERPDTDNDLKTLSFKVTDQQNEAITEALVLAKNENDISDTEALIIICEEYISKQ